MIQKSDIKDIIKDNTVEFVRFRQGFFYYNICVPRAVMDRTEPQSGPTFYTFPVPLEDIGDATLENADRAIYFMRYIRKAIEEGTFIKFGSDLVITNVS
jgi:hypothetical protein